MSRKSTGIVVAIALAVVATAAYAGNGGRLPLGPVAKHRMPTYKGYYDGHKDVFLVTDVSSKTQASAMHINFAPALRMSKHLPPQYFIKGHAAKGQLSVFGSEPGETDYNPLWVEYFVTWKAGAHKVLLVRDDQINKLAQQGKLTLRKTHIVLNSPITKVGK
jgi:hypothetical protein